MPVGVFHPVMFYLDVLFRIYYLCGVPDCKLYLLYSIICKYAIQPSGCNVLVIKLSIYQSIYLSKQKQRTLHYNQNLTFNLVSMQCFFIHSKGGWRLSDHLSPIYGALSGLLSVCFIWLLFTFLILTVCISVQLYTAEVLYIVFCSLPAPSLILRNGKRKKKETAHTPLCLVHEWIATLRCSYWNVN